MWTCLQVLECAGKHQVLIFVHSRKETAKTARYLKDEALKEDKLAQFMKVRALNAVPQSCSLIFTPSKYACAFTGTLTSLVYFL